MKKPLYDTPRPAGMKTTHMSPGQNTKAAMIAADIDVTEAKFVAE
jgi:hypothetical protein